MWKLWTVLPAALVLLTAWSLGSREPAPLRSSIAAERDGLHLSIRIAESAAGIAVESRVENRRSRPAFLVPDQCGYITEALLVRTKFQPVGRTWPGSLQALKRFVLRKQRSLQAPDTLAPRRPGDGSGAVPDCDRPDHVVRVAPGAVIRERWETSPLMDGALDAVGSEHTKIRVELVEARRPGDVEYLDILPADEANRARAGRAVRVEAPVLGDHPAKATGSAPSLGQLYDRLLENAELRAWLAAQPARSWRAGDLLATPSEVELTAVTRRYERAVTVRAGADGSDPKLELPGPRDRTRVFRSRPATLPAGIDLVERASRWRPTRDVIAGRLALPSGRLVTDEFPSSRSPPLDYRLAPGAYPVYVTLARYRGRDFDRVALATLVASDRKPVRWRRIGGIGVDAAVGAFTSVEGARKLERITRRDNGWDGYYEPAFNSLSAHDQQVTELRIGGGLNEVMFSTGAGDGGYPLLVGLDEEGRPARFVLDFYLLHLAWPGRP